MSTTHEAGLDALNIPRDHKVILSLDGGGIRGILTLHLLKRLEALAGIPCHELFAIVAGTSTCGIIVRLIATRRPAVEIEDLYAQFVTQVFTKRSFAVGRILNPPKSTKARYRPEEVERTYHVDNLTVYSFGTSCHTIWLWPDQTRRPRGLDVKCWVNWVMSESENDASDIQSYLLRCSRTLKVDYRRYQIGLDPHAVHKLSNLSLAMNQAPLVAYLPTSRGNQLPPSPRLFGAYIVPTETFWEREAVVFRFRLKNNTTPITVK